MTAEIQNDLAQKELLPTEHLVDAGYVDSQHLVNSNNKQGVDLIGPAPKDTSWQARTEEGLGQTQFSIDWETQVATCPTEQSSITWQQSQSPRGLPVIRVLFDRNVCQLCHLRERCTRGKARGITFRPREEYEALQAARQRESTEAFKEVYRKRAGIEGTLSQAIRTSGMRRSRYLGLAKTHLQNVATSAAINLHRVINWQNSIPLASTRKSRFAALVA